jgi:phosphomannomutase
MKIDPSIFKAYDIRGIYPTDINEESISFIVKAIYTYLVNRLNKEKLTLVVGHDMRISSPSLFKIMTNTLVMMGAKVINIGLSTTPTNYFITHHYRYDAGIQLTASHNPPQWNGMKFFFCQNDKLYKASKEMGMEEIKQIIETNSFVSPGSNGEEIKKENAISEEVEYAFSSIKPKHKKLKVVVDPANAMGILLFDEIFKKYPVDLIKLNYYLDGTFPAHEANPLKFETLKELQEKVVKNQADLGIATDGDGDRVFFINEKGEIISSTLISSLIAKQILNTKPGTGILCDVRYIYNVKNIVNKYGGKFILAPVGHALITKKINEENAAFCGESSGHYYFNEYGGGESLAKVIFTVLHTIATENRPISSIIQDLQTSLESGETNFKLPENLKLPQLFDTVIAKFPQGEINRLDGLTIELDGLRFNIRGSNTEPLVRLNCESNNENKLKKGVTSVQNFLLSLGLQKK